MLNVDSAGAELSDGTSAFAVLVQQLPEIPTSETSEPR